MGCCFSRPSGPNSPYPGGAANSSARAINPPPLTLPESASPTNAPPSSRRRRRDQGPLDKHIDKPLRRHSWSTTDRQWTRPQLAKERAEFFDTRVTGRPEVWQTLHAALQQLWEPIPPDATEDEALATAQSIISAAEISLPTGNLANGAYDSLGNYYQLAEHIVSDPSDLLESDGRDAAKGSLEEGEDNTASAEDEDEDDAEAEQRRAEKGKAVADARQEITVRARLSETGRDYQVAVGKSDTVRSIANRLALESNIASTKKIRIAYMGKILKENSPLDAQGWQPGHIVNALVFNKPD